MINKIDECIDDLRETEKSRPEYRTIQKSIGEITANIGSSIVDSQRTVERLEICAEPLKRITNVDIYEETRLGVIKDEFITNMRDADTCIEQSVQHIQTQTTDIEQKLQTYLSQYNQWTNITSTRQHQAQKCQQDIKNIAQNVFKHIVRE